MPKQVLSFRIDEAELAALERFKEPEDTSLGQTALRLLRGIFGIQYTPLVNAVNVGLIGSTAHDRELIRDEIEERTAYLATAMNEIKNHLENEIDSLRNEVQQVKADLEELRLQPQVKPKLTKLTKDTSSKETTITPETTIQNVDLAQAGNELIPKESVSTFKSQAQDIFLAQAGKTLTANQMKSKANSIAYTLQAQGLQISRTIIKGKILEMYPNSEDWISEDTRKEVIRNLVKHLPAQDRPSF